MKNYFDFEKEIKILDNEIEKLKDPFDKGGISSVDTEKISQIQKETGGDISSIAQEVVDEYRNTAARKDRKDSLFKDEQGYYWSRSEVKPGDNVEWRTYTRYGKTQRRACQGSCAAE